CARGNYYGSSYVNW
nr:immunoglobulin heavy chain junction region [Mus musculus]MBK4196029.1 immunoglobulin heavy chain junction region [Mus musculus]MBK4196030.1 immunoglobulin heavy chain junction region [Mus musculus]MBK4196031.1 immunoglobulin heavy chain junction region [Mus musculus]